MCTTDRSVFWKKYLVSTSSVNHRWIKVCQQFPGFSFKSTTAFPKPMQLLQDNDYETMSCSILMTGWINTTIIKLIGKNMF